MKWGSPWSIGFEAGRVRALDGAFNSRYSQVLLSMALGDDRIDGGLAELRPVVHDMRWAVAAQVYRHARRNDGSAGRLETLGLKFERDLGSDVYLTGQAHSAIAGGAGAYSAGLIGIGASVRPADAAPWRIGAEALIGAGGGGGVASRGGAVVQPMAWLGRDLGRYNRIRIGAGWVRSARGELSSPVVDLTWALAFGAP